MTGEGVWGSFNFFTRLKAIVLNYKNSVLIDCKKIYSSMLGNMCILLWIPEEIRELHSLRGSLEFNSEIVFESFK
jgi:hypothetical protein